MTDHESETHTAAQSTGSQRAWKVGSEIWLPRSLPRFMGIINVTPDSFSDGGQFRAAKAAAQHALELSSEGADVLDVGGESTRPGATPVGEAEEIDRVVPAIEAIRRECRTPISIDTTKAGVAQAAVEAGAVIVNDISGLTFDRDMISTCVNLDVAVICMHIQGTPQTMQEEPHYEDAVTDIAEWLGRRLDAITSAGLARQRLAVDPGIGFGKTARHNLEILSSVGRFHELGCPVLIGHSRKRFLKKLIQREVDERLAGTVGVSIALAEQGTDLIRVHDVAACRDAITAWHSVMNPDDVAAQLDG